MRLFLYGDPFCTPTTRKSYILAILCDLVGLIDIQIFCATFQESCWIDGAVGVPRRNAMLPRTHAVSEVHVNACCDMG